MDLPVINTPVFPRWVWIEEITYSHIPIATYITAVMVLAPVYEYVGMRRDDPRYDRFAKGLIWFALVLFSPGAALGTGIPMFLIGTYPEFWSRWANIFFWPLFLQFVFFLGEVFFLFFGYYLAWNALKNRKRLHIFFGVVAALFGLTVQFVWDGMGSYMLTPGAPLPAVNEPVAWSAAGFFNPSFPFLFSHRFFGNISYVMLLVGGVHAMRYMRADEGEEKDYLGWAANLAFTVGFLAFFIMPFIGWGYARVIQRHAPVAFHSIMGGSSSVAFTIKMGLIVTMLAIAGTYVFSRYRGRALLVATTLGLASLYIFLAVHPPLKWLPGGPMVWRAAYTVVLGLFIAFLWFTRGRFKIENKRWQWGMLVAGLAAFFTFTLGGYVREHSRQPHSVYGVIEKPETRQPERDRFLFYDRCVQCHHRTPKAFERVEVEDWKARLATERARPGLKLTEEEAARILRYLKEHY